LEKLSALLGDAPLTTTTISIHELLAGARNQQDRFLLENLFQAMQILDHTAEAARFGARIEQELSRTGSRINDIDMLIAGICKAHTAELVTFDQGFSRIKGLRAHVLS
jgi:predicted nucleic acid-binding protein